MTGILKIKKYSLKRIIDLLNLKNYIKLYQINKVENKNAYPYPSRK